MPGGKSGLKIATNVVANVTNISSLATKNSGLVATDFGSLHADVSYFLDYISLRFRL